MQLCTASTALPLFIFEEDRDEGVIKNICGYQPRRSTKLTAIEPTSKRRLTLDHRDATKKNKQKMRPASCSQGEKTATMGH